MIFLCFQIADDNSNSEMKYRSRTDIVSSILEAANGGTTKTKIMYKAYLSYAQMKEYVGVLVESGLLEYVEGEGLFKTTQKGLEYLKRYDEIGQLVSTS